MSVTNLNEIEKADVLVAGLRKHLKEAQEIGITTDAINRPEEAAKDLRQKDAEVDKLRRQATLKAHENLELIADLKGRCSACAWMSKPAIRSTNGLSMACRTRDELHHAKPEAVRFLAASGLLISPPKFSRVGGYPK